MEERDTQAEDQVMSTIGKKKGRKKGTKLCKKCKKTKPNCVCDKIREKESSIEDYEDEPEECGYNETPDYDHIDDIGNRVDYTVQYDNSGSFPAFSSTYKDTNTIDNAHGGNTAGEETFFRSLANLMNKLSESNDFTLKEDELRTMSHNMRICIGEIEPKQAFIFSLAMWLGPATLLHFDKIKTNVTKMLNGIRGAYEKQADITKTNNS